MSNTLVLTRMPVYECLNMVPEKEPKQSLILAHFENNRAKTLECIRENDSFLSSIFVARVDSIAPQIHAVFVKITSDITCYLPDNELCDAIFTHKSSKKTIAIGDELLVQVSRLPMKTKFACVTTRLTFAGHYVVVTSKPPAFGISHKIKKDRQEELKTFFKAHWDDYFHLDMVLRTNCKDATFQDIDSEAKRLSAKMHSLLQTATTKTLYSCLYRNRPTYLRYLEGSYKGEINEIVTDDVAIYDELVTYFDTLQSSDTIPCRLYTDSYPLYQLYSLKKEIGDAIKTRVWLKSGAYLVIEQTEAMTVIDVNSGKKEKRKNDRYFYDINVEAATEICRQLILRNISGICIVDFIDLSDETETESLLQTMRTLCKKDHITTSVIDITKLHLMELTRKKTGPTLLQQILEDIS
ncbi:ribonuclease G [Lachnospiraceae bacterium XBB1006]|nr:ribonuclease G [Lachnospiraceae bacterium XBB1006]